MWHRARLRPRGCHEHQRRHGRGLKLIDAIAVTPASVPVGVCAMKSPATIRSEEVANREAQHWVDAVDDAADAFAQSSTGTRAWFQIDREGDARPVLRHRAASGHWFTVRARTNRRLRTPSGPRRHLTDARRTARRLGEYPLHAALADRGISPGPVVEERRLRRREHAAARQSGAHEVGYAPVRCRGARQNV